MKVLFIAQFYWPSFSAAATVNAEIARRLVLNGHEVSLLVPNLAFKEMVQRSGSSPSLPSGCKVYRFGPRLRRLPGFTLSFFFLALRAIPLALRAHVIFCEYHWGHFASLCGAAVSIVTRRPLVIRVHDLIIPEPSNTVETVLHDHVLRLCTLWSFRRAKRILVPGDELVEVCRRMYGSQREAVDVSYNGVDTAKFSRLNRRNDLRRSMESAHIVIFSGALGAGRGLEILLQATSLIRKKVADLKVIITGDGPDLPHLIQLTNNMGLTDCIQFTGAVDSDLLPIYMASADVGIGELQQRYGNYGSTPLKIVEYMASGCVVVTANGAVSTCLIRDGFNGFLAKSGDPQSVAEKILIALVDQELAEKIRERACRTIARTFSWDVIVSDLERTLQVVATKEY